MYSMELDSNNNNNNNNNNIINNIIIIIILFMFITSNATTMYAFGVPSPTHSLPKEAILRHLTIGGSGNEAFL